MVLGQRHDDPVIPTVRRLLFLQLTQTITHTDTTLRSLHSLLCYLFLANVT